MSQESKRGDLILATVGGTVVSGSTHRTSDRLVGLIDALHALAGLHVEAPNLAGEARDFLADLHQELPGVVAADGSASPLLRYESDQTVEDYDALVAIGADAGLVNDLMDKLDAICASGGLTMVSEDEIGVYRVEDEDEDNDGMIACGFGH